MSTDRPRIRRPKLPRTAAQRSLSVLFVPPTSAAAGPGPFPGAAPSGTAGAPWNDVIARSVELGYRVIDDYVRQGEQIARTLGSPVSSAPAAAPAALDGQDFARRMSQYAMDVTTLWLQMLQAMPQAAPWMGVPGFFAPPPPGSGATHDPSATAHAAPTFGMPPCGTAPPTPAPPAPSGNGDGHAHGGTHAPPQPSSASAHGPLRVAVALSSVKLAEVRLELRPDARAGAIEVHDLRDHDKPRIGSLSVAHDAASGGFTVRIRVPADQPAGTYRGAIIDQASGLTLGSLELRVAQE